MTSLILDSNGIFGLSDEFLLNLITEGIGLIIGAFVLAFFIDAYSRFTERRRLYPFFRQSGEQVWLMLEMFHDNVAAIESMTEKTFDPEKLGTLFRHNDNIGKTLREIIDYSIPNLPKISLPNILPLSRSITWVNDIYSVTAPKSFDELAAFRDASWTSVVPSGSRSVSYKTVLNHLVERWVPISKSIGVKTPKKMRSVKILPFE